MTHILFISLLLDNLQAFQQGKGDAAWDTSIEQVRVTSLSAHCCSELDHSCSTQLVFT